MAAIFLSAVLLNRPPSRAPMLYLLLAVACSLAIAMIFKHAGREELDRVGLLTVNYATAALTGGALMAGGAHRVAGGLAPRPGLVALGVGTGVLFIGGFFLLSLATDVAGMSIATGVMRVSVVVPFTASWLIWGETPTAQQGTGLVLAGTAFFMIAREGKKDGERERGGAGEQGRGEGTEKQQREANGNVGAHRNVPSARGSRAAVDPASQHESVAAATRPATAAETAGPTAPAGHESASENSVASGSNAASRMSAAGTFGVLALLFVSGGLVDTCMKTFDEVFADEASRALFLLMVFGVAFLAGCAELARRRPRLRGRTLAWGAALGAVNYGSVAFILRAIRDLRGPFVFPANNISIVVGAALLGVWFWGERLSTLNRAGLAIAALALFLLRP
jgi:drug/metabolite transporter (DMT)-like permease